MHTADGGARRASAAKLRTPFAVLGIRTANGKLTGVDYLPRSERAQRPVDAFTAEVGAERSGAISLTCSIASRCRSTRGGSPFQRRVWQEIDCIPVGESRTYGEIARALRTGPRAVGNALRRQPDSRW
ncbi:MAG: methylated-DNA--[protein]-cysteine S-methyltransferase [Betaproteobacteria bacterium]|nr:methylated-DNA--[protein]-cysteine S-methyltransferase [Betaproteobacteria bacterium]